MKKMLLLLMMMAMVFAISACASNDTTQKDPQDESTYQSGIEPSEEEFDSSENHEPIDFDALDWIELDAISIPSIFSYDENVGLHDSTSIASDMFGISMFVGALKGDYETLAEDAESFTFDDGHVGLFVHSFDINTVAWIRDEGRVMATLRSDGTIFADNEELFLRIARSLR